MATAGLTGLSNIKNWCLNSPEPLLLTYPLLPIFRIAPRLQFPGFQVIKKQKAGWRIVKPFQQHGPTITRVLYATHVCTILPTTQAARGLVGATRDTCFIPSQAFNFWGGVATTLVCREKGRLCHTAAIYSNLQCQFNTIELNQIRQQ